MSQNKEPDTTGDKSTATASDNDEVTAHSDPGTPITVGGDDDSATGTPITVGGEGDSATGTPITVGGDGGSSEQ